MYNRGFAYVNGIHLFIETQSRTYKKIHVSV